MKTTNTEALKIDLLNRRGLDVALCLDEKGGKSLTVVLEQACRS